MRWDGSPGHCVNIHSGNTIKKQWPHYKENNTPPYDPLRWAKELY